MTNILPIVYLACIICNTYNVCVFSQSCSLSESLQSFSIFSLLLCSFPPPSTSLPFSWAILGRSWGPSWCPSLGHLGPSWGHLGPSWGRLGAFLGPLWAFLGPSWRHLSMPWGRLGPSWPILGPSWGHLRPYWG